jgi:hypothetical protein
MIECSAQFDQGRDKYNCHRCGRVICYDCGRSLLRLRDPNGGGTSKLLRACGLCIRLAEGDVNEDAFAQMDSQDSEDAESDSDAYHGARDGYSPRDAIGRFRIAARPSVQDTLPSRKSFDSSSIVHGCISEEDEANLSPLRRGSSRSRRGSNEPQAPEHGHQPRRPPPQPAERKKIHKSSSLQSLRTFFTRATSNSSSGGGRAEDDTIVNARYNGGLHIQ